MQDPGADDWWTTAFDASYAQRYAHRSDAAAAAELVGILPRLKQAPGPILDACCGNGRHLQGMRAAGLRAYGFDWSLPLLAQVRQRPSVATAVLRSDVRLPALAPGWGAITLLFTAFGYFSDAQNSHTLAALAQLLRPRGWLLLDLPHAQLLPQQLVPHSQRQLADGTLVDERRWMDGPRVCKRSTWHTSAGPQQVDERVRLYQPEEMQQLATHSGLHLVDCWPSLYGPQRDEQRQVYWLQRPAPGVAP